LSLAVEELGSGSRAAREPVKGGLGGLPRPLYSTLSPSKKIQG